jgi:hypothetical protein
VPKNMQTLRAGVRAGVVAARSSASFKASEIANKYGFRAGALEDFDFAVLVDETTSPQLSLVDIQKAVCTNPLTLELSSNRSGSLDLLKALGPLNADDLVIDATGGAGVDAAAILSPAACM